MSFLNVSNVSCVTKSCLNFACQNVSIFTIFYVDNEFVSFVNSCSYLFGVVTAQMNSLNIYTINNLGSLNVSMNNTSLITNVSRINSGLNQK